MRRFLVHWGVALSVAAIVLTEAGAAAPAPIAGTQATAPPTFLASGFLGINSNSEWTYSFSLFSTGDFFVDSLQVPMRYAGPGLGPNLGATFSIHANSSGQPGSQIVSFDFNSIPALPNPVEVVSADASARAVLHSGATYWLVGSTNSGAYNWHVSDQIVGPSNPGGNRVGDGPWAIQQFGNAGAFVLFGTPVPEPSTCVLAVFAVAAVAPWHRRLCARRR